MADASKKKRTVVVPPCPPMVATGYLLCRGACLGVVGAAMDEVSCSPLQPTYLKEDGASAKFALNFGKKYGSAQQMALPEDHKHQFELLHAIQAAVTRMVKTAPAIQLHQLPLNEAIVKYGQGIAHEGLNKTNPIVTVALVAGLVVAIPPATPCRIEDLAEIVVELDDNKQASLVQCGKKARKAEIVLKFHVIPKTKQQPLPVAMEEINNNFMVESIKEFKEKRIRMPEGLALYEKLQQQQDDSSPSAKMQKLHVNDNDKMVVTMEHVSGKVDYDLLVQEFGSKRITPDLVEKLRVVTSGRVQGLHRFLRRDIFFSHRDLDRLLDSVQEGKPMYLYTGRGPSSAAMHLGHLIPFLFTQWLQQALDCPLVIQMTDDEKFLFKGTYTEQDGDDLMEFAKLTLENARDIIACGFNYEKTFLFSDLEYMGRMYPNVCRIWKAVTTNTVNGIFGFDGTSNIGKIAFPAIQAAPSFASSFPTVLNTTGSRHDNSMSCLIPCAIDQDPYFRMTRDVAHKLVVAKTHPLGGKPALIHSKFFPPLQGTHGKMSSSDANSAIFLTDSPQDIERKIKAHAFSGGQDTKQLQQELGANLEIDVSYQWLRFFLENDDELEQIRKDYGTGTGTYWSTGKVKEKLISVLVELVQEHQTRRAQITDEQVRKWMTERCLV